MIEGNFRSFDPFAEANVVRYSNSLPISITTPITTARIGFTQHWYTPTGDNPLVAGIPAALMTIYRQHQHQHNKNQGTL